MTTPATESTENTPATGKAEKNAPTVGSKFQGQYMNPAELHIVGFDGPAPADDASPLIHRLAQAERLAEIRKDMAADLQASIETVGEVLETLTVAPLQIEGEKRTVVLRGRRRTIAARAVNERRAAQGLPPILVKVIKGDLNDPQLWLKILSENQSRMADPPLVVASNVRRMKEGDVRLGIPAMDFVQIGSAMGRNHQYARDMLKLDGATPPVKEALAKGKINQTGAVELAKLPAEKQAEELPKVIEAGGSAKEARARAATAKDSTKSKVQGGEKRPPKTVEERRHLMRGLEEAIAQAVEDDDESRRNTLVAQHSAIRWTLGEDELAPGTIPGVPDGTTAEDEGSPFAYWTRLDHLSGRGKLLADEAAKVADQAAKIEAEKAKTAVKAKATAEAAVEKAKKSIESLGKRAAETGSAAEAAEKLAATKKAESEAANVVLKGTTQGTKENTDALSAAAKVAKELNTALTRAQAAGKTAKEAKDKLTVAQAELEKAEKALADIVAAQSPN